MVPVEDTHFGIKNYHVYPNLIKWHMPKYKGMTRTRGGCISHFISTNSWRL